MSIPICHLGAGENIPSYLGREFSESRRLKAPERDRERQRSAKRERGIARSVAEAWKGSRSRHQHINKAEGSSRSERLTRPEERLVARAGGV